MGKNHKELNNQLEELRKASGLTQSELAEKVGISIVNLSRLKNGNVKGIRYATLNKICQILNCKPGDILDYKKDK